MPADASSDRLYLRLAELREPRQELDLRGMFVPNLARRLGL
ncbi:hypothetical protein [Streptomyces tailanensis]|nr:hypothetical protein [Streptomyces tailanensis]